MSLSHLSDNNSYCAMEIRCVQSIIIQAVDCNQLSVLPSISTVGKLANDPLGGETKTQMEKKMVLQRWSQTTPQVRSSI